MQAALYAKESVISFVQSFSRIFFSLPLYSTTPNECTAVYTVHSVYTVQYTPNRAEPAVRSQFFETGKLGKHASLGLNLLVLVEIL